MPEVISGALDTDPQSVTAFSPPQNFTTKGSTMKEDGNEVGQVEGEYQKAQTAEGLKYHKTNIQPNLTKIDTLRGEVSEPWQHITKRLHVPRPVMNFLLTLDKMDDDAKQQHTIDALFDGLAHLGFRRSEDLVTMAQKGDDADELPPIDDEEEFEASEAEIAQQAARPSTEKAKADAEAKAQQDVKKAAAKKGSSMTLGELNKKKKAGTAAEAMKNMSEKNAGAAQTAH